MAEETYQTATNRSSELQAWLIDLVRVGAAGNANGVRQLANRMARSVPKGVEDPSAFREEVGQALAEAVSRSLRPGSPLRRAEASEVPMDKDSALPLAQLDLEPNGEVPVLGPEVRSALDELLDERARMDALLAAGLEPNRTVLLTGPPGVGKTMTATFIANRLGLPLLTIDLASVMSSYLGRTGQNLRSALEYGRTHEAVVFVDEFDALAKRRDDDSDIGELKRLVNVLLLELERWPSQSLLIAATNHPQLLDSAIERRFDRILRLGLPEREERRAVFENVWPFDDADPRVSDVVADLMVDAPASTITAVARLAAKRVVLRDATQIEALAVELIRHRIPTKAARDELIRALHESLRVSNREIGRIVGVSHPTVGAVLKRSKGAADA